MTDHDSSATAEGNNDGKANLFEGLGGNATDNDAYSSAGAQQETLKQNGQNPNPDEVEEPEIEEQEFYFDGAPMASPANEDDGLETDSALVKQLRQTIKDQRKEMREKRITPPAAPQQAQQAAPVTLPPKPKMEDDDIGFDPDVYQQKLSEWYETEAKVKAQQQESTKAHEALVATFNERKASYKKRAGELNVRGFEDAEAFVAENLSQEVQTALILHADKPELVVLALARNPELMKQAQDVTDPVKLGVLIGTIQSKAKAMPKGKTDVSGVPQTPRGTGKSQVRDLDGELEKARENGDYSRVIELKRQRKAAAAKK